MQKLPVVKLCASALLAGSVFLNSAAVDTVVRRPSGDIYLEWDGADGGINTGYYPTSKTKILADYRYVKVSGTKHLYGTHPGGDETNVDLYWQKDNQSMMVGTGDKKKYCLAVATDSEPNARFQSSADLKNRKFSISSKGIVLSSATYNESQVAAGSPSTSPLALFTCMKADGTFDPNDRLAARIYSLTIYDDDVLVHDFIPYGCGAITGLLDRCTGKVIQPILRNGGAVATGHFKLGIDPGYVESVEKAVCQYVNTGVIADATTKIEVDFTMLSSAKGQSVFGTGIGGDGFLCNFGVGQDGMFAWDFQDDESLQTSTGVAADGGDRRVVIDGPGGTIQLYRGTVLQYEATLGDPGTRTKFSAAPIALFSRLFVEDGKTKADSLAYMRIRSAKIWENGVLVRNYEPRVVDNVGGFYDLAQGTFTSAHHSMADTSAELVCGGTVVCTSENGVGAEACLDAYVQSDGYAYVETDYYPNEKTRIEAEVSPIHLHGNRRILGCDLLNWYMQKEEHNFAVQPPNKTTYIGGGEFTAGRWSGYVDFANGKGGFSKDGQIVQESTFPVSGQFTAQYPLLFFCTRNYGKIDQKSQSRIYSVSIYEDGALVRNYLPCKIDGVVGFWETCGGKFWPNSHTSGKLTFGGAGVNGAGLVFTGQPKSCTLKVQRKGTLVAFAPTAISYQWYKDGEPIAGATHSSLDVEWEGRKPPRVHTYTCTAFFALEGTAESNAAVVSSNPPGLSIEIR